MEKYGRGVQTVRGNTILLIRLSCWLTKYTDAHVECVLLIAFLLQLWFSESA